MVAFRSLAHHPADRQLEQQVAAELSALDPLRFRRVSVSARSGVVVLMGSVTTYYAKSLGFHHALRVEGVASVVDSLQVDASTVLSH
ncbi:MAG: BON domain-containing protein [Planctomycetaceae bacterium]|jgi:osmotically-inducible protein OsmY|nr:BON domain-containing protein [Planctomycetaceae bacterium]